MSSAAEETRWCVVTGGRGFVARHLVEMLLRLEMFHVIIADLAPTIKLDPQEESGILGQALRSGRAQYISADLRNKAQLSKACEGAEVVFHMAALDSSINKYQLQYSINVQGTKNVIEACVEHNDWYSATKAEGEALVMEANGRKGLLTCCIRPSAIFGPGDRLLVPSLVSAAKSGKSKFIIGDGNNLYDLTYVENVAHAHVCAERALASGGEVSHKAAGQSYFITNMEPILLWELISHILEGLGYDKPRIKIPTFIVMPIARLVDLTYKLFGPYGMSLPQLTPSRVRLLTLSTTYDSSKAQDRLGYSPLVPLREGIRRTIDSFSHFKAENHRRDVNGSRRSRFFG